MDGQELGSIEQLLPFEVHCHPIDAKQLGRDPEPAAQLSGPYMNQPANHHLY
jgi:hypothetical protein